jgi:anthranilate phosphoribosyltransferase
MAFLDYLHRIVARDSLSSEEAEGALGLILEGQATAPQIAAFLVALRMKGETAGELLGLARAMRARSLRVDVADVAQPVLDTCGTGGDASGSFNISTVAALVVAGAGVRVAKHGNRSMASHCGSADILEALGVKIELTPERMADCIRRAGIGFLFAPALHPAMKHAGPARAEIKMRTALNLLGPLTNPAGAPYQLIGAPSEAAARLMAGALAELGTRRSFVVHGSDGMDEITTTGSTLLLEVSDARVAEHGWKTTCGSRGMSWPAGMAHAAISCW